MPFVRTGTGSLEFLEISDRPFCNINLRYLLSMRALLKYAQIILNVIIMTIFFWPLHLVEPSLWPVYFVNTRPRTMKFYIAAGFVFGFGILFAVIVILCHVFGHDEEPSEGTSFWLKLQVFCCLLLCFSYIGLAAFFLVEALLYYINYYMHCNVILMYISACWVGYESWLLYQDSEEDSVLWYKVIGNTVKREDRF